MEIIAVSGGRVYFKYHRAAEDADSGKILICRSNPQARWLADYQDSVNDCACQTVGRCCR
jgi:hypothetical protein